MIDDISDIRTFYDRNVEKEDGRLTRHPIEHDVTWKYLDTYLPSTGKILEIGAATGVYTIPLAEKGYHVTAVELSPELSGKCREKVTEKHLENRVTCIVGDGRDLSGISETDFDVALVMGPLYHLSEESDRKLIVQQVYERLKPGGRIFSAFISRHGIWGDILRKMPHAVEYAREIRSVLDAGNDLVMPAWGPGFRAHYALVPEIAPLHEEAGFRSLVTAGVEPAGITADEPYSRLSEKHRRLWLELLFSISTDPSIIGASCHLLYIGEKPA